MSSSKVVFVTGVSSGIGCATAGQFAKLGCKVFGSVRDIKKAQAIPGVEFVEMDVRDDVSVKRAIEVIIGKSKRIDVLVNSAGGTLLGSVEETSISEARALFDTNVFGTLRTTQAVLPHMRQQRSGKIINVSSVLGFLPAPYMGLYSASKHAIEGCRRRWITRFETSESAWCWSSRPTCELKAQPTQERRDGSSSINACLQVRGG
jgi:NADP-dependent 3-hydroxy acid dehydrogenase YdfG